MKVYNMIFVMGIALFLSVSTILTDTEVSEDHPNYPKILPGDLSFINETSSETCYSESDCGWVFYKVADEGTALSFARIACVCASGEQCEHIENPARIYIHYYKCVKKASRSKVKPEIEIMDV